MRANEFITESIDTVSDQIQSQLGLKVFNLHERGDTIELASLIVGKDKQGQGLGSKAMKMLIDYADEHGKRITLTPGLQDKIQGTTSRGRLVKFYKQFGFKESKGRNIDYVLGAGKMYREPNLAEKWSPKYKKSINCSNPKGFSQKAHCAGRKKNEEVEAPQPIKLKGFGPSEQTKEFVANVKSMFYSEGTNSYIFWNHEGNQIPNGKEETKDIAAYVQFELVPKGGNKVEVKWIQATPLRGGYGSKGMKILQDLAQQEGIALTLFPWDKGVIPQSKLMKFYKKQGFNPLNKSKNMIWEPK